MKKIWKIATYDFKRLIFNPITFIAFAVLLCICFITGFAYKIPTAPIYEANIHGETAEEVYSNFMSANTGIDSKIKLDSNKSEANNLISIQESNRDKDKLTAITKKFGKIFNEIKKFSMYNYCKYTETGNISEISQASTELKDFINQYKSYSKFESDLMFTKVDFDNLEKISNFFETEIRNRTSIVGLLTNLYKNKDYFSQLNKILANSIEIIKNSSVADNNLINNLKENYIVKATEKLQKIQAEINKSKNENDLKAIKNYITNYKLITESILSSVINELNLHTFEKYGDLSRFYNYKDIKIENVKISLAKTKFFLNSASLKYIEYQEPLNFNSASTKVSSFDHAYFITSIIGFFTIIFGIYASYKLFGRDRKNGKVDIIFSQTVTFNQVFNGKLLAIILSTTFILSTFALLSLLWGLILYPILPNNILAVFNLTTAYTINPFLFFLIKIIGIELQAIFYIITTIFIMNLSRKFNVAFGISLALFILATILNIYLNNSFAYCLLPFIHADLTTMLGGGTLTTGFLTTAVYSFGNFYISLVYYVLLTTLIYLFTKQLFKKN